MTVVDQIVAHARRLYWDDLKHERFTYAVTGSAKLVMIETGVTPTLKDKEQAEEMLRKGRYTHRHHTSVMEERESERVGGDNSNKENVPG